MSTPKTEIRDLTDRLEAVATQLEGIALGSDVRTIQEAAVVIKLLRIELVEATNRATLMERKAERMDKLRTQAAIDYCRAKDGLPPMFGSCS